jgi:anti-anti-sigma factor
MSLEIETGTDQADTTTLRLSGRLDTNTAPELDAALAPILAGPANSVIFDLAKLEYISSAGLRAIFKTKKQTAKAGGATFVVNPQPQVQKVFDIVKAMPGDSIFRSWAEMDAYLDTMQKKVIEGDE